LLRASDHVPPPGGKKLETTDLGFHKQIKARIFAGVRKTKKLLPGKLKNRICKASSIAPNGLMKIGP